MQRVPALGRLDWIGHMNGTYSRMHYEYNAFGKFELRKAHMLEVIVLYNGQVPEVAQLMS